MSAAREQVAEFHRSIVAPGATVRTAALAYKSRILPIHRSFPVIDKATRSLIEGDLLAILESLPVIEGARKPLIYALPAYTVCLLRNPTHWQGTGDEPAPSPALIALVRRALDLDERNPANPFPWILEGVLAFIQGLDDDAVKHFGTALRVPTFGATVSDSLRGASTCTRLPSRDELHAVSSVPIIGGPVEWLVRTPPTDSPSVLSFSGDDVYFRAFSHRILETLAQHVSTPVDLHFHVVGYNASATRPFVDSLCTRAASSGISLHVSTEHSPGASRTYFASARFFKCPDFLDAFKKALILCDMDITFTADARAHMDRFDPDKVSLTMGRGAQWGFLPWRVVNANHLRLPHNAAGLRLAHTLVKSLNYLWNDGDALSWWRDQTALWLTRTQMRREGHGGDIASAPLFTTVADTSEAIKIEGLRGIADINAAMETGAPWLAALTRSQTR